MGRLAVGHGDGAFGGQGRTSRHGLDDAPNGESFHPRPPEPSQRRVVLGGSLDERDVALVVEGVSEQSVRDLRIAVDHAHPSLDGAPPVFQSTGTKSYFAAISAMRPGSGTPPSAATSLRYCSRPPGDWTFKIRVGASLRFAKVWTTLGGARTKDPGPASCSSSPSLTVSVPSRTKNMSVISRCTWGRGPGKPAASTMSVIDTRPPASAPWA